MEMMMSYENVINMLSLWATPDMWQDQVLFAEIEAVIKKLYEPSDQLSERELFLVQELVQGLLDGVVESLKKADEAMKGELFLSLKEIMEFQSFLAVDATLH
jgi:hypothetical protein|tara:strand:- start:585 stop:890 length:306 start_codon:yes stop_codon:yes gene_type:complete